MKDEHGVWRRLTGGGIYRTLGPLCRGSQPLQPGGRRRGDEETLPLTEVDVDNWDHVETNPFVKGPWYESGYNPFLQDLWTPSFDPLAVRDKTTDKFNVDNSLFNVPINPSSGFPKPEHPVFMSNQPEAILEPSQRVCTGVISAWEAAFLFHLTEVHFKVEVQEW